MRPEPDLIVDTPHARVATRPLERVLPYLLVAPVLLYIFVILILPLLIEIYYSFLTREQGVYAYRIVHNSRWTTTSRSFPSGSSCRVSSSRWGSRS